MQKKSRIWKNTLHIYDRKFKIILHKHQNQQHHTINNFNPPIRKQHITAIASNHYPTIATNHYTASSERGTASFLSWQNLSESIFVEYQDLLPNTAAEQSWAIHFENNLELVNHSPKWIQIQRTNPANFLNVEITYHHCIGLYPWLTISLTRNSYKFFPFIKTNKTFNAGLMEMLL